MSRADMTIHNIVSRRAGILSRHLHPQGALRLMPTSAKAASTYAAPGSMYSNQDKIPRLPIPDLKDTVDRLLYAAEPLVSKDEFAASKAAADEFLAGSGPQLQEELKSRDEKGLMGRSYIDNIWAHGYLADRVPIPVNTNPYFALAADPDSTTMNQVVRASRFMGACSRFIAAWKKEGIAPDYIGKDPLDMSQYGLLFSSARIPKPDVDVINSYPGQRHLVVLCNGNVYKMPALDDNDAPLPASHFHSTLKEIERDALQQEGPGIGTLSGLERERWARLRSDIEGHSAENADTLSTIDQALMVLSLDQSSPTGLDENAREWMHSTTGKDRWYDKAVVLVVAKNGEAGINFEHAWGDGHTLMRFVIDMFNDYIHKYPTMEPVNEPAKTLAWSKLPVDLPSSVDMNIETAEYKKVYEKLGLKVLDFNGFGKDQIKGLKVSPDGFVQMAFQYAYARIHQGKIPPVYESVQTKKFMAGRTEALRSATPESRDFIYSFVDGAPTEDRAAKLRKAIEAHVKNSKLCTSGLGCDRHLLALRVLAAENGDVPAIFKSAAYREVCQHTVLSTSTLASKAVSTFGFGPVSPDGYGLGYQVTANGLALCCTSYMHDPEAYVRQLQFCLHEMYDILSQAK